MRIHERNKLALLWGMQGERHSLLAKGAESGFKAVRAWWPACAASLPIRPVRDFAA